MPCVPTYTNKVESSLAILATQVSENVKELSAILFHFVFLSQMAPEIFLNIVLMLRLSFDDLVLGIGRL